MNRFLSITALSIAVMLSACDKKPASIAVTPTTAKLGKAGTQSLSATGFSTNGDKLPVTVKWTSSDAKVASVDDNGKVTAVGSGTALITATQDMMTAHASINVELPMALKLEPSEVKIAKLTEKPRVTATVMNEKNVAIADSPVKFTSENPAVATVDSMGVVTGIKKGDTTIVATAGALKSEAKVMIEEADAKVVTAKADKKLPKKK